MCGYALNGLLEYSVTIGYGIGIVFLLTAVYFQSKRKQERKKINNN
jgi:hypothetical protein